jgi:hypothetical protein
VTDHCVRCRNPMIPEGRWRPGLPVRPHVARGLCRACYLHLRKHGDLIDYERRSRPRDEVLEEWELLRAEGYTVRQAAERLGMTVHALKKALYRASRKVAA